MLPCRLLSAEDFKRVGSAGANEGDMWYCSWYVDGIDGSWSWLSDHYIKDHTNKRPPIMVKCPGGELWGVDLKSMADGMAIGDGWKVTGDAPLLTVSPSISLHCYHGHLRNGIFTDAL